MSGWMETILVASRDAGILALVIGIAIKLSGRRMSARFCHAAWLLVAVRLLMPVLPTSPFSWQHMLRATESPPPNAVSEIQTVPPLADNEIPSLNISPPVYPTDEREVPALTSSKKPQPAIPPRASINAWDIAAGVWICGVVGLLSLGTGAALRFRRRALRLTKSHPKAGDLEIALGKIGEEFGWKRLPRLQITEAVDSPALFGLIRPRILMPPALLDDLSDFDLRLVLLHELGHWRRRDIAVNFALALAQAIHWFNPLVWWAFHRARLESERATDDWVLQRTGAEHSSDYGEMLLRLLAKRAKPRAAFSGMVSVVENPGDLRQRMTAIGRFTGKRHILAAVMSFALLIGLAAVGLTKPPATQGDSTEGTRELITENLAGETFICQVNNPENIPVPGAEVYVEVYSQIDGNPLETIRLAGKTNDAGEIEIRSAFLNTKYVTVNLFARHPGTGFGATSNGATQINSKIDLKISEGLPLSLRVLDNDGKPVSGLSMKVESVQHPRWSATEADDNEKFFGDVPVLPEGFWNSETNADGRCTLVGLPPGVFYVDHANPAYAQLPGRHSSKFQFLVEPDRPEIEVKLQPAATVSGTVSLPDGTPVAGAEIKILEQRQYKHGGSWAETTTEDDGSYHLQRLIPSDYTLRVILDEELKKDWVMNPLDLSLAPSEQKIDVSVILEQGGLVTGRVTLEDTGEPVDDLMIGIVTPDVRSTLSEWNTKTDKNGKYRLRIPPGKRKVYIAGLVPEGYTTRTADSFQLNTTLEVKVGEEVSADFTLPRETQISGVVLDPSGDPVAGATVTCFDPPDDMSHPQTVKSDVDGRFHFKSPAGTKTAELVAILDDLVSASGMKYPLGKDIRLELKVDGFAGFTGRVVDENGKPLEGVPLWCAGNEAEGVPNRFVTDADGRYGSTRMLPGEQITFWASKKGYGQDVAQLELVAGKVLTAETIVLPPAEASISGVVVDHQGNPLPGAKVGASGYLQPDGAEVSTGPDGRFELKGLVEGWLNVTAADDIMIRDFGLIDTIRTRTGRNDLLLRIPAVPVNNELEKLVDFVGKPAPPLKAETWLKSDPLPEKGVGKVRFISFVGLDRSLIFFSNVLPKLQEFREANPEKELEIILVHGAWPKEEVLEILAAEYPDLNLPIAIEPEEGAMSKKFGIEYWLYVVIDQQNKVVFQSTSDFSGAKKEALSLLKTKK